jgi:hypothetical protein
MVIDGTVPLRIYSLRSTWRFSDVRIDRIGSIGMVARRIGTASEILPDIAAVRKAIYGAVNGDVFVSTQAATLEYSTEALYPPVEALTHLPYASKDHRCPREVVCRCIYLSPHASDAGVPEAYTRRPISTSHVEGSAYCVILVSGSTV